MKTLYIDIETYSDVDLLKTGVYRYADSPVFEILIIAYSEDGKGVKVLDIASGEIIPQNIKDAILGDEVTKIAHNANFERVCLSRYLKAELSPNSWRCTAAQCVRMGLPRSLSEAAKALGIEEHKEESGKRLINIFCTPHVPSAGNGFRSRITPSDAPQMWGQFKSYCCQDVRVDIAIDKATAVGRAVVPFERSVFELDARINDRGIYIDVDFVEAAKKIDGDFRERIFEEAKRITGIANPCSSQQLTQWLAERGVKAYTLNAASVQDMINRSDNKDVKQVLEIRKKLASTSTSKYSSMLDVVCNDRRARGLFLYYGSLTGRWSSKYIQMHNLPRGGSLERIEEAKRAAICGDVDTFGLEFGNISEALSSLVRASFVAPEGKIFVICDFSAIEARVLSWLADEKWRLDIFSGDGKIYEATAAQIYGVGVGEISRKDSRRMVGKVAELALGYGGGVDALKVQADILGFNFENRSFEELNLIVSRWRENNSKIVALWALLENALRYCVANSSRAELPHGMMAEVIDDSLYITLPSGRFVAYPKVKNSGKRIAYGGNNYLYGGKITENICQAIARDCLAYAMLKIDGIYGEIVAHVHDEVIVEVDEEKSNEALLGIVEAFLESPDWAKGLPLNCEAFISKFYRK